MKHRLSMLPTRRARGTQSTPTTVYFGIYKTIEFSG